MLRITNAAIGKSGFVGGPRGGWSFAGERDVYKEIRGCRRDRGGAPSTKRAQAPFVRLPRNPHRSRPLSACCRPPLTHGDITKMLPMDPVAAALTRALSRQFSDAFITLDSQQGSPFNDSMTLHCTWRLRQRGSCRCTKVKPIELIVAAWLLKLGPRLTTSNLEYVILQGWQFHRTKWQ